jgi:16S rRNA (guanine966-N2)-methyltransferase
VRIVAGTARGRVLRAPTGGVTRPTSDRVRESIFDMLTSMDAVEGAAVLDLFAGSGAMGIEALSRGAVRATFVDRDRAAIAAIRANLAVLEDGLSRATVVCTDALRYAAGGAGGWQGPAGPGAPLVDVTFADPPYGFDAWAQLLESLPAWTGLLVAETGAEMDLGPEWETVKVKRYGGTVVTVAQPAARSRLLLRQGGEI